MTAHETFLRTSKLDIFLVNGATTGIAAVISNQPGFFLIAFLMLTACEFIYQDFNRNPSNVSSHITYGKSTGSPIINQATVPAEQKRITIRIKTPVGFWRTLPRVNYMIGASGYVVVLGLFQAFVASFYWNDGSVFFEGLALVGLFALVAFLAVKTARFAWDRFGAA